MSADPDGEHLSDQRYVTLIVRLLVDAHGEVVRGELGTTDDDRWIRFVEIRCLSRAVTDWLAEHTRRSQP